MLKFKVIEKYYLPKKTLELFNYIPNINLEITNGYARVIERTNIKQVFELYSRGNSAAKVARTMNEDYRYLRNNGKWTDDKVMNIISNPIYKGDLLWGRYSRKDSKQILIENH